MGGHKERLSSFFYVVLFPLFLIASHSPHPSSPILHLCVLYRLMACVLDRDDEMGESIGGDGVLIHGEQGKARGSAKCSFQQQCWAGAFDGGGIG